MTGHAAQHARLLIMGPPGAGKGTQATVLSQRLGVPAISTGDIFRALQDSDSANAVEVRTIMQSGGYVDDAMTAALVEERLSQPDCTPGFLLDGYPRTPAQVRALDGLLARAGQILDAVISLSVDAAGIRTRLARRATTNGRLDDTEEAVRVRLGVYAEQTAPLLELYRDRGCLIEVDGDGAVDEVSARILRALRR